MAGLPDHQPVASVSAAAYMVPTAEPESDGTLAWSATTLVVASVRSGSAVGTGYTYASPGAVAVIAHTLAPAVAGTDPLDVAGAWRSMIDAVRNVGRGGVAACAVAAVDSALWDLKARLLGLPLAGLLGRARPQVPVYGSGGFTSYTDQELADQLSGWVADGFTMVKMKVGRDPDDDPRRVALARRAIGPDVELFVDANGAYRRKQALALADAFAEQGVTWFEEPVSSDDVAGLRLIRDRAPAGMRVTAGEYGWDAFTLRRLLDAGAVDVLQADVTRVGGITGFLQADALCWAADVPLSSHCAPTAHLAVDAASHRLVHAEWFHDHARLEALLFDGAPRPREGQLTPDLSHPGAGWTFKRADAERYRVA